MCCLSTLVSKLCDPMARDKCHQKDQETRELCNRSKSDFLGFAEHSIWNMKLNAFRRGAFEPQIPPLSIALHWLLHIYIICLVLQSWVCDHLKGRRYATIGPWIVSWIISLLQRQRLESNHHQISWKWGLLGTTLFFFFSFQSQEHLYWGKETSLIFLRERGSRLYRWDWNPGCISGTLWTLPLPFTKSVLSWRRAETWERSREKKHRDPEGLISSWCVLDMGLCQRMEGGWDDTLMGRLIAQTAHSMVS